MAQEQSQDAAKIPDRPSFESWWKRSKDVLKTRKITFVQAANQLGMCFASIDMLRLLRTEYVLLGVIPERGGHFQFATLS